MGAIPKGGAMSTKTGSMGVSARPGGFRNAPLWSFYLLGGPAAAGRWSFYILQVETK